MTEAEWLWAATPAELVKRLGTTARKKRLYCVACCRRLLSSGEQTGEHDALDVAERYADGWDSRRLLDAARESCLALLNSSASNWMRWAGVAAVAAACQPGTDLDPGAVLDRLAQRFPPSPPTIEPGVTALAEQREILNELFGNPFRPVAFDPAWRTSTTIALARQTYESRDFGAMPILADALQDAGCDSAEVLEHCRGSGQHVRGCWVVDLVLGKE